MPIVRCRGRHPGRRAPLACVEVAADPYRWARSLELLDGEGIPVGECTQTPARMGPATSRFDEAVVNGGLTQPGDARLARHVANAVLREDPRGTHHQEHKRSRRRIAAAAAVMAHDRAAVLAAERGPSIYV